VQEGASWQEPWRMERTVQDSSGAPSHDRRESIDHGRCVQQSVTIGREYSQAGKSCQPKFCGALLQNSHSVQYLSSCYTSETQYISCHFGFLLSPTPTVRQMPRREIRSRSKRSIRAHGSAPIRYWFAHIANSSTESRGQHYMECTTVDTCQHFVTTAVGRCRASPFCR
jgi:hypothetical protein